MSYVEGIVDLHRQEGSKAAWEASKKFVCLPIAEKLYK
ncbi:hypothetical protein RT42_GL002187 [Enterococcus cecorum DSM 20682 = ATCC 43198]|nr:hypothetical protein RT42_GL002187 [Enterococcus cecorum DSM 20682 = ATCC 43198]